MRMCNISLNFINRVMLVLSPTLHDLKIKTPGGRILTVRIVKCPNPRSMQDANRAAPQGTLRIGHPRHPVPAKSTMESSHTVGLTVPHRSLTASIHHYDYPGSRPLCWLVQILLPYPGSSIKSNKTRLPGPLLFYYLDKHQRSLLRHIHPPVAR